jgi:hypothetical protein
MHVFSICTSQTIGRELAENRARTCMLGLVTLQKSWPVGGWVYRLFVSIMERLQAKFQRDGPGAPERIQTRRSTRREPETSERPHGTDQPFRPWEIQSTDQSLEYGDNPERQMDRWRREHGSTHIQDFHQYDAQDLGQSNFAPDLFAFREGSIDATLGQGHFFDLLDLPTWDNFSC